MRMCVNSEFSFIKSNGTLRSLLPYLCTFFKNLRIQTDSITWDCTVIVPNISKNALIKLIATEESKKSTKVYYWHPSYHMQICLRSWHANPIWSLSSNSVKSHLIRSDLPAEWTITMFKSVTLISICNWIINESLKLIVNQLKQSLL